MSLFQDAFTGTAGTDVNTRTGWTRTSLGGGEAAAQINASNQVKAVSSGGTKGLYWAQDPGGASYYGQSVVLYASGAGNYHYPVAVRISSSADTFIGWRNTGSTHQLVEVNAGSATVLTSTSGTWAANDILKLTDDGSTIRAYLNGSEITALAKTSYTFNNTSNKPGFVMAVQSTDPVLDTWESNSTGGTAYSLTGAQGSFTETGKAATLKVGHILAVSNGSFTLTGETVGFDHAIQADVAVFTLTGQSVNFVRSHVTLTASVAAFTLTGQAVNFVRNHSTLTTTIGLYALTGFGAAGLKNGVSIESSGRKHNQIRIKHHIGL